VAVTGETKRENMFVSVVLDHAALTLRPLPWRDTRDPWAVCVSEVMLQQTGVARVREYFMRFIDLFPTVGACAAAPQAQVVAAFSGLGYNRRAVYLHRTAVAVTNDHGGVFPDTLTALMRLPGIGPYTARALLAFAFEQDVAVVDTNVSRLLARAVAGRPLGAKEVQAQADALVPDGSGWLWNQGMLDFAATICTKRAPACQRCAFVTDCVWHAGGKPLPDPAEGSAFVTATQARFAGSDRQGRGRLIAALTNGPIAIDALAQITGWQDDVRVMRMLDGVIKDGLVTRHNDTVELTS